MDREAKGIISENIDKLIEQKDLMDIAKWVVEAIKAHYKIESTEKLEKMLTSAYVLGSLISNIIEQILLERYFQKADEQIYNEWLKDYGKEEADRRLAEDIVRRSKSKDKNKSIKVGITEEELIYVKDELFPLVAQLEPKLNQEIALKKVDKK